MKNKLLLHVCCAPCLAGALPFVASDGGFSCFWYNPNIHPYTEYKSRLGALAAYASENGMDLIIKDCYGLISFIQNVMGDLAGRCGYCYGERIGETAKYAKENGFAAFSSTLLVSPYQNHGKIKEICENAAKENVIDFFYGDFRENFKNGQKSAREKNIYMQKYCGCIFSEQERYLRNGNIY